MLKQRKKMNKLVLTRVDTQLLQDAFVSLAIDLGLYPLVSYFFGGEKEIYIGDARQCLKVCTQTK